MCYNLSLAKISSFAYTLRVSLTESLREFGPREVLASAAAEGLTFAVDKFVGPFDPNIYKVLAIPAILGATIFTLRQSLLLADRTIRFIEELEVDVHSLLALRTKVSTSAPQINLLDSPTTALADVALPSVD